MKPCPVEAAASLLGLLSTLPSPSLAYRSDVAAALERVPLVHPMRMAIGGDQCLALAHAIRAGRDVADGYHTAYPTPDAMRDFVNKLRAGVEGMRVTGWGWMFSGGEQ